MKSKYFLLVLAIVSLVACSTSEQGYQEESAEIQEAELTITNTPLPEPTATEEPTATQEPSLIIKLGPGKFGKPLHLQVVKGDYT